LLHINLTWKCVFAATVSAIDCCWKKQEHTQKQPKNMSRTTIKDIAKVLNINSSTVSRALKDHQDIGAKLKAKIKEVAEDLGYTPNQYAVNLRNGKSYTIGLIIPEISMYFFPSLIKSIEQIVHSKDYHLMVLHSNDELEREIENAKICTNVGVDGLLVSLTKETTDLVHFKKLVDNGVPIIFFDKTINTTDTLNVVKFGDMVAHKAVTHLLNCTPKPKKIYGIFGDHRLSITKDRVKGFEQALQENKIKLTNKMIGYANTSAEATALFKKMYADKPDAMFIMSDELLAGIAKAVKELKIQVPADVNLVSVSDGFLPNLLPFNIPYIHTSGYQLGLDATAKLFDIIEKKDIENGTYFIDTPLILQ
jgi:DNA-binding LacI/PurR family transcriptional regulator